MPTKYHRSIQRGRLSPLGSNIRKSFALFLLSGISNDQVLDCEELVIES